MKTIVVAGSKGGIGKSSLALNLAGCVSDFLKVGIADIDLQGSLTKIKEMIDVEFVSVDDLLSGKLDHLDLVIVDTPPYLSNRLPELFKKADYVLVPCKPSYFDVMALQGTVGIVKASGVSAGIVITMKMPRTSITRDVEALIEEYGLYVHPTHITHRVSYIRSPITASVFNSTDEKAKEEITELAKEIFGNIGVGALKKIEKSWHSG